MDSNIKLAPGYLQKNIPEFELNEDMNKNPYYYAHFVSYTDDIKKCIDFEDKYNNLEIKSFVTFFDIRPTNLSDALKYSNYQCVEESTGKIDDSIDYMSDVDITHIKNILHSYENVITFNQYFKHQNKYACIIIMLCYNKKTLPIEPIELIKQINSNESLINNLETKINELQNDISELKNIFILMKKHLSECGK